VNVTATAGTVLSNVSVATFTDANPGTQPSDYTATIDWGDGTTPTAGTVQAVSGGGFRVVGTHTYAAAGTFSVHVTVNDINAAGPFNPNPASASVTGTATVSAAAVTLTAQGVNVTGTAGTALTNVPVATFTDTAANAQAGNYTVTINWDDGTAPTAGTVQSLGGGQFRVVGSHTYLSAGTFQPAVTITSSLSGSSPDAVTVDTTATISPGTLGPAPSSSANQAYVNQLFLDLLGKTPTPQQLSDFSSQLNQGKSRTNVVHQIEALAGYKTHQVEQVYLNMFGTGPTAQQLTSGVQFLNTGHDVGALRVRLLSSDHFFQAVGGGTDTGFLNALGRELLHGSLDAATQARLTQRLANGASHLSVLQDLVKTDRQQIMQQGVRNLYQQYLHRAPTAAELSTQVPVLGRGEKAVVTSLVTSDEYFNDSQKAAGTSVTSSASPSVFGQSVTFTATVAPTQPGLGTPTGTVTFADVTSGATLGTATLDATGKATFTTTALSLGTHTVRADYSGDSKFPASSGTVTQTVNRASTTTALASATNPSTANQSVTFTATVTATAPGSGTPTGTVTFTDTTSGTTLGTANVDTTGKATFSTTGLGIGTHTITASYAGTGNFAPSNRSVTQTVNA
jgi:Bacterial Ig-like domain (group 3)